jgi:hypothetical protein
MLFASRPRVLRGGICVRRLLMGCPRAGCPYTGCPHAGYNLGGDGIRYTCFLDMIAFGAVLHCCALLRTVVELGGVSRNILCVGHVPGHVLA